MAEKQPGSSHLLILLALLLCAIFLLAVVPAPTAAGNIEGEVTNENGDPIQYVNVSVSGEDYNYTNSLGEYKLTTSDGTQTVNFSSFNYTDKSITNVDVTSGSTTFANATLTGDMFGMQKELSTNDPGATGVTARLEAFILGPVTNVEYISVSFTEVGAGSMSNVEASDINLLHNGTAVDFTLESKSSNLKHLNLSSHDFGYEDQLRLEIQDLTNPGSDGTYPVEVGLHEGDNSGPYAAKTDLEGSIVIDQAVQEGWVFETEGPVRTSPQPTGNGSVVFGSDDGRVYAVDKYSGYLRWWNQTGGKVRSTPTVHNGYVWVGSDDGNLYKFNATYGFLACSYNAGAAIRASPVVNPITENILVGDTSGSIHEILPSGCSGNIAAEPSIPVESQIGVDSNNNKYVGGDSSSSVDDVIKYNSTWANINSFNTGSTSTSYPTIGSNSLFIGSDKIYAQDTTSIGTNLWTYQTDNTVPGRPKLGEFGLLFASDIGGNFYGLDRATGDLQWQTTVNGGFYTAPEYAFGSLYAGTNTSRIYGIGAAGGVTEWSMATNGIVKSEPTFRQGFLYFGSDDSADPNDGYVYGLGLEPPVGTAAFDGTLTTDDTTVDVSVDFDHTSNDDATIVLRNGSGATVRKLVSSPGTYSFDTAAFGGLNAGEELSVSLYDARIENSNTLLDQSVTTVTGTASFAVSIEAPATGISVSEDEELAVDVVVENTGGVRGSDTIALGIGDSIRDELSVTLDAGSRDVITLRSSVTLDDDGSVVVVRSSSDQDSRDLSVSESLSPASYALTLGESPETIRLGEVFELPVSIENTGDQAGNKTASFRVDGEVVDERNIALDAGEMFNTTIGYTPQETGAYLFEFEVNDTVQSRELVVEPAPFGSIHLPDRITTEQSSIDADLEFANTADGSAYFVTRTSDGILTDQLLTSNGTVSIDVADLEAGNTLQVGLFETSARERLLADNTTGITSPEIGITPGRLNMGRIGLGDTGTQNVSLENTGSAQLTIDEVALSGNHTDMFSLTGNESATLEPGEELQPSFSYQPTEPGQHSAVAEVRGASGTLGSIPLRGTGILPNITIEETPVEFEATEVSNSSNRTIALRNTGNVSGVFDRFVIDGDVEQFTLHEPATFPEPAESVPLGISYAPQERGDHSASIAIVGTGGNLLGSVDISGTSVDAEANITPRSLHFGDADLGDEPTRSITIANDGELPLTIERVALENASGGFSLVDAPSESVQLGANEKRPVQVEFAPSATGSQSTYLHIETDAPDGDRVIPLTSGNVQMDVDVDEEGTTNMQAQISNASGGQSVDVDLPDVQQDEDDFKTDRVEVTPNASGDIELDVETGDNPLESTPATNTGFERNTTMMGNISAESNLDNDEIDEVGFTVTVDKAKLERWDTDPGNVSFYRYDESREEWIERGGEVVSETNETATIRVTDDHFSEWTAAAARPEFDITETNTDVTTATVDESVTIQVFVENVGGTEGTYVADLLLDGEVIESKEALVADGGEELFQFERSFSQPGVYEVQVNEVKVDDLEITEAGEVVDDPDGEDGTDDTESQDQASDTGGDAGDGGGLPWIPLIVGLVVLAVAGAGIWYYQRDDQSF